MLRLTIYMVFTILCACKSNRRNVTPTAPPLQKFDSSIKLMVISSAQTSPYTETIYSGSKFQVVIQDKDTIFMSTRDTTFKTPEGYGVGGHFGSLPKSLKKAVRKEPGFIYWVSLKSGWRLGFCEGSSCTDHVPFDSSKIDFIYKRK